MTEHVGLVDNRCASRVTVSPPAQPVVDHSNSSALLCDVYSPTKLDEISLDEARMDRIYMRLAEFVVCVTECSSRRALSLIRGASNETPLRRLAIALAATLIYIRTAESLAAVNTKHAADTSYHLERRSLTACKWRYLVLNFRRYELTGLSRRSTLRISLLSFVQRRSVWS